VSDPELLEAIRRLAPDDLRLELDVMREKRIERRRKAISLMGGRCTDCHTSFPDNPEVYEFDHIVDDKAAGISRLLTGAWATLAAELKKCELVCCNCHIIRTTRRREEKRRVRNNGL